MDARDLSEMQKLRVPVNIRGQTQLLEFTQHEQQHLKTGSVCEK